MVIASTKKIILFIIFREGMSIAGMSEVVSYLNKINKNK